MKFLFIKLGFHLLYADHSIFIISKNVEKPIIITFINDSQIFIPSMAELCNELSKN